MNPVFVTLAVWALLGLLLLGRDDEEWRQS